MGGMNLGNGDSLGASAGNDLRQRPPLPAYGAVVIIRLPWFRVV